MSNKNETESNGRDTGHGVYMYHNPTPDSFPLGGQSAVKAFVTRVGKTLPETRHIHRHHDGAEVAGKESGIISRTTTTATAIQKALSLPREIAQSTQSDTVAAPVP